MLWSLPERHLFNLFHFHASPFRTNKGTIHKDCASNANSRLAMMGVLCYTSRVNTIRHIMERLGLQWISRSRVVRPCFSCVCRSIFFSFISIALCDAVREAGQLFFRKKEHLRFFRPLGPIIHKNSRSKLRPFLCMTNRQIT